MRGLDGNEEYDAAIDTLLARPQRTLRIFDRQLGSGYNGLHRYELLRAFLLRSRANRLYVVVHDAGNLARDCPRVVNLLRQFSHAITVHETEAQAKRACDPIALADERDYLHRFHYDQPRALLALDDPQGAHGLLRALPGDLGGLGAGGVGDDAGAVTLRSDTLRSMPYAYPVAGRGLALEIARGCAMLIG